ncbi:uncharacterized protein LOC124807831 [Hydra vulgaris]|uniref:uncharacterized protein LOC124807831 n=1 Tax=Hydra vulgaris TaxID=6087 RepID=UPI0032EA6D7B
MVSNNQSKSTYLSKRWRISKTVSSIMKYISESEEEASIINDELNNSLSNGDSSSDNINFFNNINPVFSSIYMQASDLDSRFCNDYTYDDHLQHFNYSSDNETVDSELIQLKLVEQLREWAVKFNITHVSLTSLLKLLNPYHPLLPQDSRTLLKTPRSVVIIELGNGTYYHLGLRSGIESFLSNQRLTNEENVLTLCLNVDGISLSKSTLDQFRPKLCYVMQSQKPKPFVVGIYMGKTKPDLLNEYLDQFVTEAKELLQGILFNGAHYIIQVGAFVYVAPARAFLKNIRLHSGYSACEKCVVEGEWSGRVIYTDVNCQLLTNEGFAAMDDQEHHKGSTPLLELGIGMFKVYEFIQIMSGGKYIIVEFIGDEVEPVPLTWLSGDKKYCYWPPYHSTSKIKKAIITSQIPNTDNWSMHEVIRLFGTADTYGKAIEIATRAELTSSTEVEEVNYNDLDFKVQIQTSKINAFHRLEELNFVHDESHKEVRLTKKKKITSLLRIAPTVPSGLVPAAINSFTPELVEIRPCINAPKKLSHFMSNNDKLSPKHLSGINQHMLKLIVEQKEEIKELCTEIKTCNAMLNVVLSKLGLCSNNTKVPDGFKILGSWEDTTNLDDKIECSDFKNAMIGFLEITGGIDVNDTVRNVLKGLFTHELALKINWMGKNGKYSFCSLALSNVVMQAVRCNFRVANVTNHEIKNAIMNWFRYAKNRNGGRTQRLKRPHADPDSEDENNDFR